MSIIKLMLPPVVSSGQYQIIESKIAMVEHIAMTDSAIIGPQWHNLRTSWRFSNVTKADKKFIFSPQVFTNILAKWILKYISVCYFWPVLSRKVTTEDPAHIFSCLLRTQQQVWPWVTGAVRVPCFLAQATSGILSCQSSECTILVTHSNSPPERQKVQY